jgi:excisionase family DNA binding protein
MPAQNEQQKLLFTRKEVAQLLSLGLRTVDGLVHSKELRVVRIGRKVLVHRDEIQRFARRDHETRKSETEAGDAHK